jgi:uncharacterized protein with PIN domain
MKHASFRFYEELNDFLPRERRKVTFEYQFVNEPRLIEVIESFGVPHSQVDLIIINGQTVDFNCHLKNKDRVAVYPMFEAIDIAPINILRPKPLRKIKFIIDVHLGRLAKYLRMCGFDAYFENLDDDQIVAISVAQKRIILTKDRGLLKNRKVTHGYWVRAKEPREQLLEIINRFDLVSKIKFLVRCLICNSRLVKAKKNELGPISFDSQLQFYDRFYLCKHCHKIYWEGSHYNNMVKMLKQVIVESQSRLNHR